jgi:hypothetical protein
MRGRTDEHAGGAEGAARGDAARVADGAGEEVRPRGLCDERGRDVRERDDALGRRGRDEVERGGEDEDVEDVVDQPEREERERLPELEPLRGCCR